MEGRAPSHPKNFHRDGGSRFIRQSEARMLMLLKAPDLELVGMALRGIHAFTTPRAGRQVLLMHYPEMANALHDRRFDLILAGHSHGGQVRLPFYGALIVPRGVGPYELGYYETPGGPLYVNAGIGTYRIPLRLNCRPEITVVTM